MHNHGKNICILFRILSQFPFTASARELDHYSQKVNIRVASRVAERLKTQDLRKLGNPKVKLLQLCYKIAKH